jgi:hypothetical protein
MPTVTSATGSVTPGSASHSGSQSFSGSGSVTGDQSMSGSQSMSMDGVGADSAGGLGVGGTPMGSKLILPGKFTIRIGEVCKVLVRIDIVCNAHANYITGVR